MVHGAIEHGGARIARYNRQQSEAGFIARPKNRSRFSDSPGSITSLTASRPSESPPVVLQSDKSLQLAEDEEIEMVAEVVLVSGVSGTQSDSELTELTSRFLCLSGADIPQDTIRGSKDDKYLRQLILDYRGDRASVAKWFTFFLKHATELASLPTPKAVAVQKAIAEGQRKSWKPATGAGKGKGNTRPCIPSQSIAKEKLYLVVTISEQLPWQNQNMDPAEKEALQGVKWHHKYLPHDKLAARVKALKPLLKLSLITPGCANEADSAGQDSGRPVLPATYEFKWEADASPPQDDAERSKDESQVETGQGDTTSPSATADDVEAFDQASKVDAGQQSAGGASAASPNTDTAVPGAAAKLARAKKEEAKNTTGFSSARSRRQPLKGKPPAGSGT